jgi:DEAD/DEAH box helicase domain-containing protein
MGAMDNTGNQLASLLSRWRSNPEVASNIVEWRTLPARAAQVGSFPVELDPYLVAALTAQGIQTLYTHQMEAWKQAKQGQNFVVQTGTASGKTLCYNLPVLDQLLRDDDACALYLFPTKALAQDQLAKLHSILEQTTSSHPLNPIHAAIYDGDTPTSSRTTIRSRVRLLISNPDMLHTGILPHHANWARFWRGLRYVVIDEMHSYRGVFGSHVANVIRRMKRVARFYGSAPQFIFTTATIGNPVELAQKLIEEPVSLIDQDGAAKGVRHFLIYNPPLIDPDLGIRRSVLQETVKLAEYLLTQHIQTVVFGRSRRSVEILLTYLRELFSVNDTSAVEVVDRNEAIRGYRSGYLPGMRRDIEAGLRRGDVQAVVATNALELGVDIGGMGAAILAGYPGTISGTWQQAGRAGRGDEPALAVLVTSASPLDQFLARQPEYFFGRSPEQGLINADNLLILLSHLRCAAFELPFRMGEGYGSVDSEKLRELLEYLVAEQILFRSGGRYFWMADNYPAQDISLRSASAETVVLHVETNETNVAHTIGLVDRPSAIRLVHPGAIYLHEARQYFVRELNLEQNTAVLQPTSVDYYTEPRGETTVMLIEKTNQDSVAGGLKANGDIQVHSEVVGYRKVRWHTHETLGMEPLQLPPSELVTTGYWLVIADETVEALTSDGLWLNQPNNYGPRWSKLGDQVRARDGYRCQVCGLPESGKSHAVHHKVPFRLFASPDQANQYSNLVTLCPVCHRLAETAVRVRSGLAGLTYALSNLAPLHLMCDPGDLGSHADVETAWADGKPSVVLYDLVPAGIGFSERLYDLHDELLRQTHSLVAGCQCSDGCPSCVGPGGEGGAGGKKETLGLLERLI